MSDTDPNRHWNGLQWLMWNGYQWVPEQHQQQLMSPQPMPYVAPQAYQVPATLANAPLYPAMAISNDQNKNNPEIIVAWVIAVLSAGYMLPWAIAATRGRSNSGAIGLLNLFLGWSLIGWIVALVMACSSHQVTNGPTMIMMQQSVNIGPPAFQGVAQQPYPPSPPPPSELQISSATPNPPSPPPHFASPDVSSAAIPTTATPSQSPLPPTGDGDASF